MSKAARVAQIALLLNAAVESIPGVGFALGLVPHAGESPVLARRVASCFAGGIFMFVFVAMRIRRHGWLIALPIAYVLGHLVDSVYELVRSGGQAQDLAPVLFEAMFVSIYTACGLLMLRPARAEARA